MTVCYHGLGTRLIAPRAEGALSAKNGAKKHSNNLCRLASRSREVRAFVIASRAGHRPRLSRGDVRMPTVRDRRNQVLLSAYTTNENKKRLPTKIMSPNSRAVAHPRIARSRSVGGYVQIVYLRVSEQWRGWSASVVGRDQRIAFPVDLIYRRPMENILLCRPSNAAFWAIYLQPPVYIVSSYTPSASCMATTVISAGRQGQSS